MDPLTPRLLTVGHLQASRDWHMEPHSHPFGELVVVIGGKMTVEIQGRHLKAESGSVLLYPVGAKHRECSCAPHPIESVFLGMELNDHGWDLPLQVHDRGGRIRMLTRWLVEDESARLPQASHVKNSILEVILTEMVKASYQDEDNMVGRVRQYMRSHLGDRITLADLANQAGMSKYHFARQYKAEAGRTAMQELRHMRLRYVQERLASSSASLRTIAPEAGFGDEYHLSRVFRKVLHINPSEFRKEARRGEKAPINCAKDLQPNHGRATLR